MESLKITKAFKFKKEKNKDAHLYIPLPVYL